MHTSTGLRMMMQQDLRIDVSDRDFKRLMIDEGFEPADRHAEEWEFYISSRLLRLRRNARVGGWLVSMADDKKTRLG